MIIDKKVKIKVNSRNYDFYKSIINNIRNNELYEINIEELFHGSHLKINVECDICKKRYKKPYRQYLSSVKNKNIYCCSPKCAQFKNNQTNSEKYGCLNPFQNDKIKEKIKEKILEKYGVEYPSQSTEIREKIKYTLVENYGVEFPGQSEIIKHRIKKTCLYRYGVENINQYNEKKEKSKQTRIDRGLQIPDEFKRPFELYRRLVDNLTIKNKKNLLENWDGYDFYDGEYIKDNFHLPSGDAKYPTIDHKISVKYGFNNNISPEEISKLDNLCITKRRINASKGSNLF